MLWAVPERSSQPPRARCCAHSSMRARQMTRGTDLAPLPFRGEAGGEGALQYNSQSPSHTTPRHTMNGEQHMTHPEEIVAEAEAFARDLLTGESSGHDGWHIARVRALSRTIAQAEGADTFICALAALLHDIAAPKIAGDWESGLARVRDWLTTHDVPVDEREHILE